MSNATTKLPSNLSDALRAKVEEWGLAIEKAPRKHRNNPFDAFEFLYFEDHLKPQLSDELLAEANERREDLDNYAKVLMSPLYEKQLRKELDKIVGIKKLSYSSSIVLDSPSYEETQLMRVPNGLIYKFYKACGDGDIELVSTQFVECRQADIEVMANEMMLNEADLFKPYILKEERVEILKEYLK